MVIAFVGSRGLPYQSTQDRKEANLEQVALRLVEKGHDVHVFADPTYTDLDVYQGITLTPTASSTWSKVQALRKIKNLDVLHLLSLNDAWVGFWISVLRPDVRIIAEIHDYTFNPNIETARERKQIQAYLIKQFADEIIAPREDVYQFFAKDAQAKTTLVYPGLSVQRTKKNGGIKTWDLVRRQYLLVESYANRDQKNLKLIIEAYKKLYHDYPLVVTGSVTPEMKKKYASEMVLFIGSVSGATEREVISNARYVIPSSTAKEDRTFLYMALAHATPVLAERQDLNMDLIEQNALYYCHENLGSIINMMKFMEGVYPIMSERAIKYAKHIEDLLSPEGQVNRYVYLYVNAYQKKRFWKEPAGERISIPVQ